MKKILVIEDEPEMRRKVTAVLVDTTSPIGSMEQKAALAPRTGMNRRKHTVLHLVAILILIGFALSAPAQQVFIPDPGLNAAIREALQKTSGTLSENDLLSLTSLRACCRNITSVQGLEAARNLLDLDLNSNSLTDFVLPSGLTNLISLSLFGNQLTNVALPGATHLKNLDLFNNRLTRFALPAGLTALTNLDLSTNELRSFTFPADATNLVNVLLFGNLLTNVTFSANLNRLENLALDSNRLRSLALPAGLTRLSRLTLSNNQLTNLTLRADMGQLSFLDLQLNELSDFTLPPGLTNLNFLSLSVNNLPSLTLPPDANLTTLELELNPLTNLVLSDPLAATNLAELVQFLRDHNVAVLTYPLTIQLVNPRPIPGAFHFDLTAPPGVYTLLGSTDLVVWSQLAVETNTLGFIRFDDTTAHLSLQKFYQARVLP